MTQSGSQASDFAVTQKAAVSLPLYNKVASSKPTAGARTVHPVIDAQVRAAVRGLGSRLDHPVEQAVAPHIMVPKRSQTVNGSDHHKDIRCEFVPLIDAMPGSGIAAAELRH